MQEALLMSLHYRNRRQLQAERTSGRLWAEHPSRALATRLPVLPTIAAAALQQDEDAHDRNQE